MCIDGCCCSLPKELGDSNFQIFSQNCQAAGVVGTFLYIILSTTVLFLDHNPNCYIQIFRLTFYPQLGMNAQPLEVKVQRATDCAVELYVCIDGRRYVCCSECNVVSNECNEHTFCLVQPICTHGGEVVYFGVCFRGEVGFLNCVEICICVVNKQFELHLFVFDSVYVDLH